MGCKINWAAIRRCFVDLFLYLSVLILLLAIYKHLIPPTTGYFNCNDPSIWLPYKGDTFSTKVLIAVSFLTFFVFVFLTELTVSLTLNLTPILRVKTAAISTANVFLIFFLSMTWNVCINLVLKTLTAIPRPHFIATCNPDWSAIDCEQFKGNVEYNISHCQVPEEELEELFDAMKSFPSGHAQLACFTATFLIIYLQHRLHVNSLLTVYWLQLVLVIMASMSSISRITDNRHHPADVWVGAILGILVAILATMRLQTSENCKPESFQETNCEPKKPSQIGLLGSTLCAKNETTQCSKKDTSQNP